MSTWPIGAPAVFTGLLLALLVSVPTSAPGDKGLGRYLPVSNRYIPHATYLIARSVVCIVVSTPDQFLVRLVTHAVVMRRNGVNASNQLHQQYI
ncbi:hypothetical protein F4679DRAFT_535791 [Xylaria curta]|nr:hypothetical protein F4679DRAFT_535791 [Xylaria curta]